MANEEHLRILKQGVEVWNNWRKEHRKVRPDLNEADLHKKDLSRVDLHSADLAEADLSEADLSEADFRGAYLYRADLSGAALNKADLSKAEAWGANFNGADLSRASLHATEAWTANFNGASLYQADLSLANLAFANLSEADLREGNLNRVSLRRADFSQAIIGWTMFGRIDLSEVKGLDTVQHTCPSTIGIDTITSSYGEIPEVFLKGAGVTDTFITFMQSLTGEAINFYSCFISHSSQDKPFVKRLYADLQAKDVRCWYAPEDLKIGEPFLLSIEQGIRLQDKLLLVLSEHSVASGWVQHEVLSALAKEQGKEPWVLFPIRVDDAVMDTNVPWASMIKQSRHIGDFTHWKDHDAYQKAFERLLRDLKAEG